jgi:hypothetical protein
MEKCGHVAAFFYAVYGAGCKALPRIKILHGNSYRHRKTYFSAEMKK